MFNNKIQVLTLALLLGSEVSAPYQEGGHNLSDASFPKRPDRTRVEKATKNHDAASLSNVRTESEYITWRKAHQPNTLVYGGLPKTTEVLLVLTNTGYISGYDTRLKESRYVSYRLFKISDVGLHVSIDERPSSFHRQAQIPGVPADPLAKTKFQHGHLAPNYAMASRYGAKGQYDSFSVANFVPMSAALNNVFWRRTERWEADFWANAYDEIWVIAGPIFDSQHTYAKERSFEIPDYCFKVWVDEEKGKLRVISMLVPQFPLKGVPPESYLSSIDTIERLAHIDIMPQLPDSFEEAVESKVPSKYWEYQIKKPKQGRK